MKILKSRNKRKFERQAAGPMPRPLCVRAAAKLARLSQSLDPASISQRH